MRLFRAFLMTPSMARDTVLLFQCDVVLASSWASGASDQGYEFLWMGLFMTVPMTPSVMPSDLAAVFVEFNFLLSMASPLPHGVCFYHAARSFVDKVDICLHNMKS